MENATINSIFMDMFFSYGYGLDMKTEDKRPKRRAPGKGKSVRGMQVRDRVSEHENRVLCVSMNYG